MRLTIPDFSRIEALVVGDVMLDRYWQGPVARISPEAPVPIVRVQDSEQRPGGAGNVACNIAALGARVTLIGLTGADEAAGILEGLLQQHGVQCRWVEAPGHATITKLRVLSRHQQLIRLDFEQDFSDVDASRAQEALEHALAGVDIVILSDYGKGTLRDIAGLIAAARRQGAPVIVDPKGSDYARYRGATALTPNLAELEAMVGACPDEATLVARGEALRGELELDALLVTRSDKGMSVLERDKAPVRIAAHAREVYDVTGAGDTVIAVLGASLAAGLSFAEAAALANLAAGVVVARVGTAAPTVAELQDAMRTHEPLRRGVVEEQGLMQLTAQARAHGERLVMTNGCFDVLHAGHVAYLAQAAALGDRLVVAVNDDPSVRRLKGTGRPVSALTQRMAVLAALACVDWVVAFSEDTPERLVCRVLPDTLVKGGDYTPERIAGGGCVREHGGEVVVLDYIEGSSTSAIIDSIRKHP